MPAVCETVRLTGARKLFDRSRLVVNRSVFAKIDRPEGVISFQASPDANEQLNDWAGDIGSLLSLVERSCHLIQREEMVAAASR
jgi:26S proteasome regulatory subunit N5